MAKSYSSDEDALQHDSDAGESQVSGSTPTGSDIEDEAPQAKEEAKQPPHPHNTRYNRGRANTATTNPLTRTTLQNPRGTTEASSRSKREGTSIRDPGVARGSPKPASGLKREGTSIRDPGVARGSPKPASGLKREGTSIRDPGVARGSPTSGSKAAAREPHREPCCTTLVGGGTIVPSRGRHDNIPAGDGMIIFQPGTA